MSISDRLDQERIKGRIHKVLVPYYLKPSAVTAIENDVWKIIEDEVRHVDQ